MDDNGMASSVARAVATAMDWTSSADARMAAHSYIETVKAGDVRVLANTAFCLVKRAWPSEIRLHAFKMLQHLVRVRWEELTQLEQKNFSSLSVELISEVANPCEEWSLKSQTAAVVAEILRREGLSSWQELLPSIIALSNLGPLQAELVLMILRWLPEDITVHNEDLEGDRRRNLLRDITQSLPEILPLVYTLLERHYGSVILEAGRQKMDIARQHSAAVVAAIGAVNAYAEWAPLPDLARHGIIQACGCLLTSPDYRIHACEFFKLVSSRSRKKPHDDSSGFDLAMKNVLEILVNTAKDFFTKSNSSTGCNESEFDFAEYVCESLVLLGSANLKCLADDCPFISFYLEQMLFFFQHHKLALHYHSLLFWLSFLRDQIFKSKVPLLGNSDVNYESAKNNKKRKILSLVTDEMCSTMLDISFLRMLKKEKVHPGVASTVGNMELWSNEFENKIDFSQYRSRLLELFRLIGYERPLVAAAKVSARIAEVIRTPSPSNDLVIMESMHLALENVVASIFDVSNGKKNSEDQFSMNQIFTGLLQQLILLKWTEPAMVEVLGHYLDALGPFLRYYPDAVGSVINKLFELLTSLPFVVKDSSSSAARHARLQICASFIRIAKGASESLLPCMKAIASTMTHLLAGGLLLRAEQNLLGEAFLIMASSAGAQQQQEVLFWLLEPLGKQWTQLEWQEAYLNEPAGISRLCGETQFMWSIFHIVTFFEKALKRSGFRRGSSSSENSSNLSSGHPMSSHLLWMLPPLLKLLRAIHSLWSPSVTHSLCGEMRAAMIISDVEIASLLGEGKHNIPKDTSFLDESQYGMSKDAGTEPNEADMRNWLRGIRESGYSILGLSATIGDSFFRCIDAESVIVSLMENVRYMEFRHVKQMVHLTLIPIVKLCPSDAWETWLEKLLHPLLLHVEQALSVAWSGLLQGGKAKVPDLQGVPAGSDLVEIMEEMLLRNMTREICSLFAVLASPRLNPGIPPLDPACHNVNPVDSPMADFKDLASGSLLGFVLNSSSLAIPVMKICIEAFSWTDGEAMSKVSSLWSQVVLITIMTNNTDLRGFVCKDLFSAIIQGLTLESNAVISAALVGLCRDIFVHLSDKDPSPRQILMSLPCITPQDQHSFEEALSKTASPREQKQLIRNILVTASGNKLKALATQKSINVVTNVTVKPRTAPEPRCDESDTLGLASIM